MQIRTRTRGACRRVPTLLALLATGCGWIALGIGAARYPTTAAGEAANLVVVDAFAYATLAEQGLAVLDARSGEQRALVPPAAGSESVDDLAVADGLLFALDARPPGFLSVYALSDPLAPSLSAPPVAVPVGPFSGVSAAAGRVVVSGGTSELTARLYAPDGRLGTEVARADFGRGQPDVLLAPDGVRAFVSTHRSGPHFGLTTARLGGAPLAVARAGALPLDTVGFTAGGAKPASFPIELALSGDVLLVATARGLSLVDVAELERPRLLAELALPMRAVNVDVRDGTAALVGSCPRPTLALVDVHTPSRPRLLRAVPLPEGSRPTGVALAPGAVLVAAGAAGVRVVPE